MINEYAGLTVKRAGVGQTAIVCRCCEKQISIADNEFASRNAGWWKPKVRQHIQTEQHIEAVRLALLAE